jgi:diaminohydroxyphosphoribosylaminopyrimidine deaminase/5-amino-6-(5-phosphoribosylamino)uracil reductase
MHHTFMLAAIEEAKKGKGNTFKNPLVGAAIVKDGKLISLGAHLYFGKAHAEVNAINNCKSPEELFNSILYVTLEPCNHRGKQPPCTQAIIDSGIKEVIIGQLDPNPLVSGKGKAFLEAHGIKVTVGVEQEKCRQLNPHYNYFFENNRPYIVLKQALSLDGKVSLKNGYRYSVTGKAAISSVRKERGDYQGIVVGSETVLIDNPSLLPTPQTAFLPVRIILDRRGRVQERPELHIFQETHSPVWIFTENANYQNLPQHVKMIYTPNFSFDFFIETLKKEGIQSLYIEGGPKIHDAFLAENLWDELISYIAPKLFGGNSPAAFNSDRFVLQEQLLEFVEVKQIGKDIRVRGRRMPCLQD